MNSRCNENSTKAAASVNTAWLGILALGIRMDDAAIRESHKAPAAPAVDVLP